MNSLIPKSKDNSVLFCDIMIPPTSNHQYKMARRGNGMRLVASDQLKLFKDDMQHYPYRCKNFIENKYKVKRWRDEGEVFEIHCSFFLHHNKIFTQQNRVKKMDVSNRIKALHDCLSQILEIDDSLFFKITAEKRVTHENLPEMVVVEISPYT